MWWDKLLAGLVALLTALLPYLEKLGLISAGAVLRDGANARKALKDVEKAADARRDVELMSDADVLRYLRERGLLRVEDEPGNGKPH